MKINPHRRTGSLVLALSQILSAAAAEGGQDFDLILQAPHLTTATTMWNSVRFAPDQARYPRPLKPESGEESQGNPHAFVPTILAGGEEAESKRAFYLDAGPLLLVFAVLLEARDPMMENTRAYFRAGPQCQACRHDTNCFQLPVLEHEMSSCEPCYSWNVFHSWQLGDRARVLEGMYSLFAGAVSRQTRISCETRGGITGNVFAAPLAIYLARLAVIDDQLRPDELHLLRLMPLAWLAPGQRALFRRVPTEHGPVTVETRRSPDGKTLETTYEPVLRSRLSKVWLHVPPIEELKFVKVNGKPVWSGGAKMVAL